MRAARTSPWFTRSTALPVVVLLVCCVCAYFESFGGVMLFDDIDGIVKNPALRAHTLAAALDGSPLDSTPYGRPLVLGSLFFNYRLGGIDVAGYHAVNLAIHLGNGVMLFYLALRLLSMNGGGPRADKISLWTAWCIALLWVLHPLNTAAVTYIVQRAESMMALCYFGALTLWARGAASGHRGKGWFLAATALCGLGMLAKESMVTAPLVIVIFDAVFLSEGWREAWRRRWRHYSVLAAAWIPLVFCMAKWPREHSTGFTEKLGAWDYLLMQSEVIWHYLRLAVWPTNLALDYAWSPPASFAQVWLPFSALALLAAALIAGVARRNRAAFLGLFGFIVLAPTSSIVPVHTSVAAEHRMYLPLAGWIALLVLAARVLWRSFQARQPAALRAFVPGLVVILAVFWGTLTWRRNLDYGSAVVIWSKVTAEQPRNYRALNNLASAHLEAGRTDEARTALVQALAIKPDYAEALFNLGTLCGQSGQIDAAEDYLSRALRVAPNDADIHCNLANVYLAKGNNPAAILSLERALKLNPAHLQSRFNLAVLVLQTGNVEQAEKHLGAVRAVEPAYPKWELLDAQIKAARVRAGSSQR